MDSATTSELQELLPYLTEQELAEIDGLIQPTPKTFREYTDLVSGGTFHWYRHNQVLGNVLQRVADGSLRRVMVFEPPRHGKSEQVSRLFSGYYLHRHPSRWVGLTSYGAELAYGFSRRARANFRESGGQLSAEASAVKEWQTQEGGGLWAAGVGGPLTGRGGHLLIIDDPVKNAEEANSPAIREKIVEWYKSDFSTRAEPNGAIVLVMTRWHEEDLAGWLLNREPKALEGWHIVNFEAIREDGTHEFPPSCTVEPDWRDPGDPLCPERFPLDELAKHQNNPRTFASLYQQRPRPREGSFFKYGWFQFVDAIPSEARRVRYWDTAGTQGGGDYTVGVKMSEADGVYYVEDVIRGQWSPGTRDGKIRLTAEGDGRGTKIWLEEEAGVAGKDRTRATTAMLSGFSVRSERPTGSKEDRADPLASQAEVGNVRIVKGSWNTTFLDELCGFPHGKHDDQVDAASGAFAALSKKPATMNVQRLGVL